MREILFRGRYLHSKEWAEGDLTQDKDLGTAYIQGHSYYSSPEGLQREEFLIEVDPETVGQFTGFEVYEDPHLITGEDGKAKLFEFDVVRFSDFDCNGVDEERIGVIYWCDGGFYIDCTNKYGGDAIYSLGWAVEQDDCMERIGNRWDNPELLEGES